LPALLPESGGLTSFSLAFTRSAVLIICLFMIGCLGDWVIRRRK
jgi:hypothetical protein